MLTPPCSLPAPLPIALEEGSAFGDVLDRIFNEAKYRILSEHTRLLDLRWFDGEAQMPEGKSTVNEASIQISSDIVKLAKVSDSNIGVQNALGNDGSGEKVRIESGLNISVSGGQENNDEATIARKGLSLNGELNDQICNEKEDQVLFPPFRGETRTTTSDLQIDSSKALSQTTEKTREKTQLLLAEADADVHLKAKMHLDALHRRRSMGDYAKAQSNFERVLQSAYLYPVIATDTIMSGIIITNAVIIGIRADTPEWPGWVWIECLLCLSFSVELCIKLKCLGLKGYFCKDMRWNLFEVVLLTLSITEVIIEFINVGGVPHGSAMFRIFRLLRLSKLLRICRLQFASDLVMMVTGAIGGVRTLLWSIVMIATPLYVVALIFRDTLGAETGESAASFSTVSKAFFNLFRCIVAGDCSDNTGRPIFVLVTSEYGWIYGVIYAATLLFMVFGLFNVIVAIYVENTVAEAHANDMKRKQKRLRDTELFKQKALELAMCIISFKQGIDILREDWDLSKVSCVEIKSDEFDEICDDPQFTDILCELDISPDEHRGLFEVLDVDCGGTLDISELITGIAKLRGEPRKSDIVGIILSIRHVIGVLDYIVGHLKAQDEVLCVLQDFVRRNHA